MKEIKFFNKTIQIEEWIYSQHYDQWLKHEGCRQEANVAFDFYEGGDFLDIGAFNGIYSYILAEKAKNGDKFISFEPDSRFFGFINDSLLNLKNNFAQIEFLLNTTPVGDGNFVNINFPNTGPNGEIGHPCFFGASNSEKSKLKTIKIDDFLKDTKIKPSLIKIDVEGAEYNVLLGMQKLLSENKKPKIILEMHDEYLIKNFNINPEEVTKYILNFGYKYKEMTFSFKKERLLYFDVL